MSTEPREASIETGPKVIRAPEMGSEHLLGTVMGATELNSLVRRWRRGAALGALVAGLAVTVALHHGGLEGHGPDAAVVCLAVVGAVLLVAAPTAPRPRPVPRARSLVSERGPRPLRRPAAAARDGPATLQVFLS